MLCSVEPFCALFESLCWILLFGALWIVINYCMLLSFSNPWCWSGSILLDNWYSIIWIYELIFRKFQFEIASGSELLSNIDVRKQKWKFYHLWILCSTYSVLVFPEYRTSLLFLFVSKVLHCKNITSSFIMYRTLCVTFFCMNYFFNYDLCLGNGLVD